MKTSINLPDELVIKIRKFNHDHPEKMINMSGVCRKSLEEAFKNADDKISGKKIC